MPKYVPVPYKPIPLKEEFKIIDIEHSQRLKLRMEVELLRILLSDAKDDYVSTQDRFTINKICARYPEFAIRYNVKVRHKL